MADKELQHFDPPHTHLISAFLAMEPPDWLLSLARVCGGGSVTESVQRFIWDQCISRAVSEQNGNFYRPYLKRFLKKLIVEVESTGAYVLEEFYEQYATFMISVKDDDMAKGLSRILKSVSFLFPDDCSNFGKLVIPLQCSLNLLEGDTGCSIWPSSLFLSEFILSFPEKFSGKTCFEVGSGVGLVGICLAHVRASKVTLSDGDLSSLANMKLNLDLNQLSPKSGLLEPSREVECKYLPWESASECELQDIMPDLVLGADVIYDPLCIPHLIRVLSIILRQRKADSHALDESSEHLHDENFAGTCEERETLDRHLKEFDSLYSMSPCTSNKSSDRWRETIKQVPVAYIASVVRNIDTFNYFLTVAEQADLSVTDLSEEIQVLDLLPYMQSYQRSNVKLFCVSYSS
ncbi:FAM86 domain-containing protein [Heracleum sosnowskyi]|uniref:FAM86 domain-containing protein n=1 Tax=Heracleum sosnowskyi TaxID=360622 RepID=A0AAD8JBM9_9APIA|nr:FAM86 domain-containing protein [Heracleum sosnowskyi]